MNFRVDRWRAVALRSSLVALATVGALLLSSCGGSGQSSQSKRFKPTRMIVFGDEASLLLPPSTPHGIDALKYTNNGVVSATDPSTDCLANPLWVQELATKYGLVFDECNPGAVTPTAQMRATVNGKVADVVNAVNAFLASSAPVPTDLITVMVGTHDILELYDSVKSSALTQAAAVTEIQRRGALLGGQINRLTNDSNTLGRVLYSTVPQLNLTPYGRSKSSTDQTLLQLLTDSFNDSMRRTVNINGRSLGFLNTSQQFTNVVDAVHRNKSVDSITNVDNPGCGSVNVLVCKPSDWVAANAYLAYLWADDLHFSTGGHVLIGDDAVNLATSLPW